MTQFNYEMNRLHIETDIKEGILYHGTSKGTVGEHIDFSEAKKAGINAFGVEGFFASDSASLANQYSGGKKEGIVRVKITPKNPKTIDAEGRGIRALLPEEAKKAQIEGHDCLIIKNVIDVPGYAVTGSQGKGDVPVTETIAF